MQSVGINLEQWSEKGLLVHEAWRPTQYGIETHLLRIHKLIEKVKPESVILDPITNLINSSSHKEVHSMLIRLMDYLKGAQITALFVSLTGGGEVLEKTAEGISSLADTWILLRDVELNGERNRCLYVLKSRGMAHSNQLREFLLTKQGIQLIPAYLGTEGVLTGSSRLAQEAKEKADVRSRQQEAERKRQEQETKRLTLKAQIASLQAELDAAEREAKEVSREEQERVDELKRGRDDIAKRRGALPGNLSELQANQSKDVS
jgi:circadian clock protein KaiC